MAFRPLLTTGAALISAGAIVAATPAFFVPNDDVQIAAPAAAERQTLTPEQLRLLAVTLQGLSDAFFQGYGGQVTGDGSGDCTVEGAVCPAGFVGVPYYLSDQLLPLGDLDNIFFEEGFTGLAREVALTIAALVPDPTGRLDLVDRVEDFFEGGVTQLVGNLLLDNLPEDTFIFGITDAFFFGYGEGDTNAGFVGAINYVVDAFIQGTPTPTPTPPPPAADEEADATLLSETAEVEDGQESGPTSTRLPFGSSLFDVSTPSFESPFKRLVSPAEESEVKTEVVDEGTGEGEDANPLAAVEPAPAAPEAPKFEAPKLPEFKLPALKLPQRKVVEEEEAADDSATVDTKDGNKVEPVIPFGKPKSSDGGGNFFSDLNKAFKEAIGGDKGSTAGGNTGGSGTGSGGTE
ncbi:hypothetical protein [Mycolicibacterium sp. XJ870]